MGIGTVYRLWKGCFTFLTTGLFHQSPLLTKGGSPSSHCVYFRKESITFIFIFCHISTVRWPRQLMFLLVDDKDLLIIWVKSWRCGCLVTWFCYQMIAKPGNKTATPSWPELYTVNTMAGDGLVMQAPQAACRVQALDYNTLLRLLYVFEH